MPRSTCEPAFTSTTSRGGGVGFVPHQAEGGGAAFLAEEAVDAGEADAARHVLHLARQLQLLLGEPQKLLLQFAARREPRV